MTNKNAETTAVERKRGDIVKFDWPWNDRSDRRTPQRAATISYITQEGNRRRRIAVVKRA